MGYSLKQAPSDEVTFARNRHEMHMSFLDMSKNWSLSVLHTKNNILDNILQTLFDIYDIYYANIRR